MIDAASIHALARRCGFKISGIAAADSLAEHAYYMDWVQRGFAGRMAYLTDHRAEKRSDVRALLPAARSVLVVGKLYNGPAPYSTSFSESDHAWISRYAWGEDYHVVLKRGLQNLVDELLEIAPFEYKICVDTAPVMERALARRAGLGWIGKNTCLINEQQGSWFFLGEVIWSLALAPNDTAPSRCGTCTRCIDACPTTAIVPRDGRWEIDSRACLAYLNIELKGTIPEDLRGSLGRHIFGCDICQDVCPWNRRAPAVEREPDLVNPPLDRFAALTKEEFAALFGGTAVERTRYQGFLRNVCVAMGNSGEARFRPALERLAGSSDAVIQEHAQWALRQLCG